MSEALIEIDSLTCGYGARDALTDITLRIAPGEMVGIMGPNGSGKTTLLLAIAGIIKPRSGAIKLAGELSEAVDSRSRAKMMAAVPQQTEISFPFKCLSVVLMGRYPHLDGWGSYSEADMAAALSAMRQTKVAHLADRMVNEVSGGESQMVAIARALAQEAQIMLLDEATSYLDASRKIQVFDLLSEKNRGGATLLCVMHDLNLAALYCTRLIFLKHGKVALDGPTEIIFNERNLSEVYETDIKVSRHPVVGSPQAHFVPGVSSVRGAGDR